jgi:hypothetical protein
MIPHRRLFHPYNRFWRATMNSVYFCSGACLRLEKIHIFSRPIQILSSTTDLPQLDLDELFAFLTNLDDRFHIGTISHTQCQPYQERITICCSECSNDLPAFIVYTDLTTLLFGLKIKQYCPHQAWIVSETENRRQDTFVSGHMPLQKTEWAKAHPFRVICKKLMRSPLFPQDLKEQCGACVYSRAHNWRLARNRGPSSELETLEGTA